MPATATTLAALRALIAPMSGEATAAAAPGNAARTIAAGNAARTVATGIAALDREIGGGFAHGAIHELVPAPHRKGPGPAGAREAGSGGDAAEPTAGIWGGASTAAWSAATGFALALAARAAGRRGEVLWIADERAAAEWGEIYAPGLAAFGVDPARFLLARARRGEHVLRIMEDALRSPALAVVGELALDRATTLTASRRLALAARGGGFGLLLRPPGGEPTAAATRWRIAAAASLPPDAAEDDLGGLGRAALRLELLRNRGGRSGASWLVGWNGDEHIFFEAASRGLSRPLRHGPPGADVAAAA